MLCLNPGGLTAPLLSVIRVVLVVRQWSQFDLGTARFDLLPRRATATHSNNHSPGFSLPFFSFRRPLFPWPWKLNLTTLVQWPAASSAAAVGQVQAGDGWRFPPVYESRRGAAWRGRNLGLIWLLEWRHAAPAEWVQSVGQRCQLSCVSVSPVQPRRAVGSAGRWPSLCRPGSDSAKHQLHA